MTCSELKARIESLAPETFAEVVDLTGKQNQFQVLVISPAFIGLPEMEQHRLVFDLLRVEFDSEQIHALNLQTLIPEPNSSPQLVPESAQN